MIHAFNYCGERDRDLCALMEKTLAKYCSNLASFTSRDMDKAGYGNGAGWPSAMMKVREIGNILRHNTVMDHDWILSIDSDVVFCDSGVFKYLNLISSLRYTPADIIGIHQVGELAKCTLGDLHNYSGCSIYLRAPIARAIAELPDDALAAVRDDFVKWTITENEDVVISYLAQMVGARPGMLPNHFFHSDEGFEKDLISGNLRSFYHLNYPTEVFNGHFLGEPITGKWDIPGVLRKKNITI